MTVGWELVCLYLNGLAFRYSDQDTILCSTVSVLKNRFQYLGRQILSKTLRKSDVI